MLHERGLHRMQVISVRKSLDGRDGRALKRRRER